MLSWRVGFFRNVPLGARLLFLAAMAAPRLIRWFGTTRTLVVGLLISTIGPVWLAQLSIATPYLTAIAMPMVLIDLGQGLTLTPLTTAGVSGVPAQDAGALMLAAAVVIAVLTRPRRRPPRGTIADGHRAMGDREALEVLVRR